MKGKCSATGKMNFHVSWVKCPSCGRKRMYLANNGIYFCTRKIGCQSLDKTEYQILINKLNQAINHDPNPHIP